MPLLSQRTAVVFVTTLLGPLLVVLTPVSPGLQSVHASVASDRSTGRALFHEKGCEHCHGIDGLGGEKGPDLAGIGKKLKPDQLKAQILHGGDAMPPFADVLAPDEIKLLVDYLSAKKKAVKVQSAIGNKGSPVPPPNSGGSDDQ
jgi:mono/diheme cytochrome c family protein